MKRFLSLILIAMVIFSMAVPASAAVADNMVQPRWSYLNSVTAYLNINFLGIATCEGTATARVGETVEVTVRLQQLKDTGWATIKTWTSTGTGTAAASGNYAVYSGYTYRTSVTGYVYDSDGNLLETGTATDTFEY